jgi:hypothetical protein
LYPTLEVVRATPRAAEHLAHNSVPLRLSDDDFKQVVDSKSYLVKAIYLPHPQFQEGGETASIQLEPGQDALREATRRGEILLILRLGNIDKE